MPPLQSAREWLIMPVGKGPHKLVAPHELSSKLLFRMRRQDRAPALACLDQPEVLQQVFLAFYQSALVATLRWYDRSRLSWDVHRTRLQARTSTTDHSADRHHTPAGYLSSSSVR